MIPMLPQDKANHFIYGLLISKLIGMGFGPGWGLLAGVAAGVLKELGDAYINYRATGNFHNGPHGVEYYDFLFTAAGAATAYH